MKAAETDPVKTMLTISVGFTLIYLLSGWRWILIASFLIGLIGVLSESLSKLVSALWMKLAWVLSLIVPNILLGLIYYLFLLPVSLCYKVFRKEDPLRLRNDHDSTFKDRDQLFNPQFFEKPW